jgi:hypothetical protein
MWQYFRRINQYSANGESSGSMQNINGTVIAGQELCSPLIVSPSAI